MKIRLTMVLAAMGWMTATVEAKPSVQVVPSGPSAAAIPVAHVSRVTVDPSEIWKTAAPKHPSLASHLTIQNGGRIVVWDDSGDGIMDLETAVREARKVAATMGCNFVAYDRSPSEEGIDQLHFLVYRVELDNAVIQANQFFKLLE